MTLEAITRKAGPYTGTGVAVSFPFAFKVFTDADVLVTESVLATGAETVKTIVTDYSVVLNADQDTSPGGSVVAVVAPATTVSWTITSQVAASQGADLVTGGGWYPQVIENALDRAMMVCGQLSEAVARCVKGPISSSSSQQLPLPEASKVLGWNSTGTGLVNYVAGAVGAASSFMASALGAATSLAFKVLMGISTVALADYGTLGVGNDHVVVQTAVNAVQGTTVGIEFPSNYTVQLGANTINITNSVRMTCSIGGRMRTFIAYTGTSNVVFNVTSANAVEFVGLYFVGPNACTAGSAVIKLAGSGGVANSFSKFADCWFSKGYRQIETVSAYAWHIHHCYFSDFVDVGVVVENTIVPDDGDSLIDGNCVFANASTAYACIRQYSSGGLKIIGNKLVTAQHGYRLDLNADTSDLVISANSIENFSVSAIAIYRTAGTFNNIAITGNQIALGASGIMFDDTDAFFSLATVVGNMLSGLTSYGIAIHNASGVVLDANRVAGTGGATVAGIYLGAAVTGVSYGVNQITGFTTLLSDNSTAGNITRFTRPLLTLANGTGAPADLLENIVATVKVPAACMGANGAIRLVLGWAHTNNANVKTLRARLGGIGGTVVWTANGASASVTKADISIVNASGASQITTDMTQIGATLQATGATASAVDTAVAQTLVITVQKATAGDTVTLQTAVAELLA